MEGNVAYTKANLMQAKKSLELSKSGYELLDKKRNVLIMSLMGYINDAKKIQDEINITFKEAYAALQAANMTLGVSQVFQIASSVPNAKEFSSLSKSIMGVEIHQIVYEEEPFKQSFSFYNTNTALDIAYIKFQEVKKLLYKLCEVEDAVVKLALEVKKTQKRTNALSNIQIPRYEKMVKNISEVLEEKDREEFFRLKKIKQGKEKKKAY